MDYYLKLTGLNEDKLLKEIEMLSDKIMKVHPGSTIHKQMMQMYEEAHNIYQERLQVRNFEAKPTSDVIEIGEIVSEVTIPDYTDEELLNVMVDSYTSEPKLKNE